ncbi:MAG: hypothetical protein GF333_02515 [Candidatus Omnitrophica bacterium]|nr:hypothetical protein [Candidatus Omnitrophota bacterium]
MSRKIIALTAVFCFAVIGAGFAAVENIKVSGDVTAQAVIRDLSQGSEQATTNDAEDFLFSQIRLRFDADLTENVSAVVGLINERLWGAETSADTDIDLDLGYVELKEFLYQPLTLTVGRQRLMYGNGLILADPDTNQGASAAVPAAFADLSMRKSFDSIKAVLDYAPYTIDIIYAQVAENNTDMIDDISVLGTNVAYQWADYNGITEGYFFAVWGRNNIQDEENQDKTYVFGARTQWDPNDKLTVGLEGAYQFGDASRTNIPDTGDQHLEAYAAQVGGEYKFLDEYNSKLGLSYTFLSGDNDADDGDYNGWDPLFENQTPAEIINLLTANTNAHFIQVTGSMMPREDITLGLVYAHALLAEKYNGGSTYQPSMGPANGNTYTVDRNDNHFGDEIDLYAVYDYTEDVQLKLKGALFMPGSFFAEESDNTSYSIRGAMSVLF